MEPNAARETANLLWALHNVDVEYREQPFEFVFGTRMNFSIHHQFLNFKKLIIY